MTEDIALIEKRAELKHQLAAGEYKSLGRVSADSVGRLIQKLLRNQEPLPFWYSMVIIILAILLLGFLTSSLLGEIHFLPLERILLLILVAGSVLILMIAAEMYIGIIFTSLRNHLLDAIESVADLADLQGRLAAAFSVRNQLFFAIVYSLLVILYSVFFPSIRSGSFTFGTTFLSLVLNILAGAYLYQFLWYLFLIARLSRYQLKLYEVNPSSSEIIDHLSDMLNYGMYIIAIAAIFLTLIYNSFLTLTVPVMVFLALVGWAPLTALFITNQYALTKIITKAKWKKLNAIQAQVVALETQEHILDEKTLEHIRALINYHDHIKATPNSALNIRVGLNFLNSLLLPVLSSLLLNLEKVGELFF